MQIFPFPKIARVLFESPWLMTKEAQQSFLADLALVDPQSFFGDIPTYTEESEKALSVLQESVSANLTMDYTESNIPDTSIAYHRIWGTILSDYEYRWYFSSKRYEQGLIAADNNPQIVAHFVHVNSGGGEAWYLDRVWETTRMLKKPLVVLTEKRCCSAAYYLSVPATKIFSLTQNDTIGSIGTMVAFWDIIPYFESMGIKWIEEYADKSDLKNKKFNDLRKGKAKKYIKEELNPLQIQFESACRSSRESIAKLAQDHEAVRGETFDALRAKQNGLIDDIILFGDAVEVALKLGNQHRDKVSKQQRAINLIN